MSTRYLGGIIRKTPLVLDPALGNAANGVFTMSQYMQAVKNATWPGFDPYFNQTVLSLHGNGTNGAQNNTFLDGSTNNFTITRNGNTTQGTFSPFSGPNGYWSNFFDGTNDRLTIADNAVLRPGTGNFTIEAWVYRAAAGAAHTIFAKGASTPTGFAFLITSSDTLRFTDTSTDITSTGTVAANTWVHVAVAREGTGSNQLKLYINGVQDGQGTVSTNFNQTEEARIGENRGATDDFNGYISNFRYVVGSAIYTAGFTPSTSPLTTTSQGAVSSEVELLTCQSNRFVDNSTNGFTVTRVNDVRVTPFSPFAPSAAYSAGTNGGSGYFDGTGDWLDVPDNSVFTPVGGFTVEAYVYLTSFVELRFIASQFKDNAAASSSWGFYVNTDGTITGIFYHSGATGVFVTSSGAIKLNEWNHIAFTWDGSNLRAFINGSQSGSNVAFSGSPNNSALQVKVGAREASGNTNGINLFIGYMAGLRIVNGSAVYTTTYTPPTSPLTAISGTSLLCNFTNAGIFDNTGKNVLETVGNAQIDTTTKKFGTGSMEFDGTGDYLIMKDTPEMAFGSGNFTIEFWLNTSDLGAASDKALIDFRPSGTNGAYPYLYIYQSKIRYWFQSADRIIQASTLSTGTWYHVALTRSGSGTKLFVNGTQEDSTYTNSDTLLVGTNRPVIGANSALGANFNGFIDDLRITKGVARYTANFTAQTSQWQDQ